MIFVGVLTSRPPLIVHLRAIIKKAPRRFSIALMLATLSSWPNGSFAAWKSQPPLAGPYRIVLARSDHVFDVEDLLTETVASFHSYRLRLYHNPSL
jgi:hypothetical protein